VTEDSQNQVFPQETANEDLRLEKVTPEMDRLNARIFAASYMLSYFAAPVLYVGIVQAALCNKLGADATTSHLAATLYSLGFLAPLLLSWFIPYDWEQRTTIISSALAGLSCLAVAATLFFGFSASVRIAAVILQGGAVGFLESIDSIYRFQCLGRGTTVEGRARALRITYTFGPMCAVLGSLTAQYILGSKHQLLAYPYNFALIFLIGTVCLIAVAALSTKFRITWLPPRKEATLVNSVKAGLKNYRASIILTLLWAACLLWNTSINSMPTISLFGGEITRRAPQQFSGMIMAIRFIGKAFGGWILGMLTLRYGIRTPLLVAALATVVGIAWSFLAPTSMFFFSFLLLGIGELATPYYRNYVVSVSPATSGAQNLTLLSLAMALAGLAPVTYGALADNFGFRISLALGVAAGFGAFWILARLPANPTLTFSEAAVPEPAGQ
jgi:MFS family permease